MVNAHRELIFLKFACKPCKFLPELVLYPPEVGLSQRADFSKSSRLHLSRLAKSCENLTFSWWNLIFLWNFQGFTRFRNKKFEIFKVFLTKSTGNGNSLTGCASKPLILARNARFCNKKFEKYKVFLTKSTGNGNSLTGFNFG